MIDNFALALCHGLMFLAAWRVVRRADLDDASLPPPAPPETPDRGFRSVTKGRARA
jgi:hypothetical protein